VFLFNSVWAVLHSGSDIYQWQKQLTATPAM
jgi:hypothetical protein